VPGMRRLDDPLDFVRMEIEAAIERDIPIIPLLVNNATMPTAEDLPPSLHTLVYRNGLLVRPDPDFHNDMGRLIAALSKTRSPLPRRRVITALLGAVVAALVALVLLLAIVAPVSDSTRLVGLWKANSFEQGTDVVILWDIRQDRTTHYKFFVNNILHGESSSTNWSIKDGIFQEQISEPNYPARARIKFLDDNHFELTILDNGMPNYNGMIRNYYRQTQLTNKNTCIQIRRLGQVERRLVKYDEVQARPKHSASHRAFSAPSASSGPVRPRGLLPVRV